ncbi:precorrin-2 dehydrogenase/sirohydrochlorin ferrochelatase family protein [Halodesulfurarchaeum sp.]|uniref:precorrin-2 dehydrogenase/sirohydrochlorin ferrochelatase family protein n=1 Tax=Halodesulfurarchaeum sp. TaxID=1980530 RepID=UPI001BB82D01|nr:bifunctional precorrin-2 dehydrogenase/sirohydrochlorin ferrochelatase [Halodesulfurarchaeum sp.]
MIPLFHDFDGKQVLIFGGGLVAARKAALFAPEADVIVRSREFIDRFSKIDCRCIRTDIDPDLAAQYVDSAFLVIPATDDQPLNDRLAEAANAVGALVNRVDEIGETVTPSVISGDHVTVGFSTGGASPAVSKYLRRRLEDEIEAIDPMVALQSELRETVGNVPESERRAFLWAVLEDDRIRSALRDGDWDRARTLAEAHRP